MIKQITSQRLYEVKNTQFHKKAKKKATFLG